MMGGMAAVAGALGPTIGGVLTSSISWRAVLLINVPLLVVTLVCAGKAVPADVRQGERAHIDFSGAAAAGIGLVTLVFGLGQTTVWGWARRG